MLAPLVSVLCDTSFLIHLATRRIRNIETLETEIGPIKFAVPSIVLGELDRLAGDPRKGRQARAAAKYATKLDAIQLDGSFADTAILRHVERHGGIIATMDRELKRRVKGCGGSVISVNNDRIVLEP